MGAWAAFCEGIRRVTAAPALLLGMCLVTLLVALPLSLVVRESIEQHLGQSLTAESVRAGANYDWWQEFTAQASGAAATFGPGIIGFGAVLENLDGFLDNRALPAALTGVTISWLVIWSFLSGGVLDRLARARRLRSAGFFAACGVHFWRFVRLGAMALAVYAFLFGYVHGWIFEDAYTALTRDVNVERTAFGIRLGGYLLFGALLVACNLIFDFARVRIVVEDRRSAIGAAAAGARFVARNAGRVLALYLMNGAAFLALVLLYALLSPGAPGGGVTGWLVLLVGQVYIVVRHYLKLVFYASETAFFQSALAHAAYTAAPPVVWPDSPAAESLANADSSPVH